MQSESSEKIKSLQAELITSVRNAEIEAEKKYSVVIDRYNKTKQMVGDIVSSVISIKDEYWQIKAEMTSLQNMIRPAMTKAHKEVCCFLLVRLALALVYWYSAHHCVECSSVQS